MVLCVALPFSEARSQDDPRPKVAFRFELTSQQVAQRHRADTSKLHKLVADSASHMLFARFPIIRLDKKSKDTVVVRVREAGAATGATPPSPAPTPLERGDLILEIELRGPSAIDTGEFRALLEPFNEFLGRSTRPVDTVAAEWRGRVRGLLESQGEQVVEQVLGQLRLNAKVDLPATLLDKARIQVHVNPSVFSTPDDDPPQFRVLFEVIDTTSSGFRIPESAGLLTAQCRKLPGQTPSETSYVCDITNIVVTKQVFTVEQRLDWFKKAERGSFAVYVRRCPRPQPAAAPGLGLAFP